MSEYEAYGGQQAASAAQLPAGFRLINPNSGTGYRIVRTLGQGGFGITYEGVRSPDGLRVAVKELYPVKLVCRQADGSVGVYGDRVAFGKILNSFYKEAQVLYGLKGNSAVVELYDAFYANNTAYYVMEFISGGTLQAFIEAHGPISAAASREAFSRLMQDVERVHRQCVIHRDISPDNIMITETGQLKLVDFGSARLYAGDQNLTANVKRNFAPIEQYKENGQGRFTDVYALAATMYFCFTGKLVPGATDRIRNEEIVSPVNYGADLTEGQVQALRKALAVRPGDRFQTMEEFAAAYFGGGPGQKTAGAGAGQKTAHTAGGSGLAERLTAALAELRTEPALPLVSALLFLAAVACQLLL